MPGRPGRPAVLCSAGMAVKEPSTGVEFPLVRTFWVGEAQRNIGAGVRQKKFAFVGVKVTGCFLSLDAMSDWSLPRLVGCSGQTPYHD